MCVYARVEMHVPRAVVHQVLRGNPVPVCREEEAEGVFFRSQRHDVQCWHDDTLGCFYDAQFGQGGCGGGGAFSRVEGSEERSSISTMSTAERGIGPLRLPYSQTPDMGSMDVCTEKQDSHNMHTHTHTRART